MAEQIDQPNCGSVFSELRFVASIRVSSNAVRYWTHDDTSQMEEPMQAWKNFATRAAAKTALYVVMAVWG